MEPRRIRAHQLIVAGFEASAIGTLVATINFVSHGWSGWDGKWVLVFVSYLATPAGLLAVGWAWFALARLDVDAPSQRSVLARAVRGFTLQAIAVASSALAVFLYSVVDHFVFVARWQFVSECLNLLGALVTVTGFVLLRGALADPTPDHTPFEVEADAA